MKKISTFIKILLVMIIIIFALSKLEDHFNLSNYIPFLNTADPYSSPHVFVLDKHTGEVILKKNATSRTSPASLTKIMTALVALEQIEDLDTTVAIDVDTYQEMVVQNASMAGFLGKEEVTYRDLLY